MGSSFSSENYSPLSRRTKSWAFIFDATCHGTSDRSWFDTYTPYKSTINMGMFGFGLEQEIVGVGTVKLKVQRKPDAKNPSTVGYFTINDVFHIPKMPKYCNIIGQHILKTYDWDARNGFSDKKGHSVALPDRDQPMYCVKLANGVSGRYTLQWGGNYMLQLSQSEEAAKKYRDHLDKIATDEEQRIRELQARVQYTEEEKEWIRETYGNEYTFLTAFQIDPNDRLEGKKLLNSILKSE